MPSLFNFRFTSILQYLELHTTDHRRCAVRQKVSVYLLLLQTLVLSICSGLGDSAEAQVPQVDYYANIMSVAPYWSSVSSRADGCQAWADYENNFYGNYLSNPRPGRWQDGAGSPPLSYGGTWSYSCIYRSVIQGNVNENDERWPLQGVCGDLSTAGNFILDIGSERCLCKSGYTSVANQCIQSCPSGQTLIQGVCHGGKGNGLQCMATTKLPISISNGNKYLQELIWQTVRGLNLSLAYNYYDNYSNLFGNRWRSPFDRKLQKDFDNAMIAFREDGRAFRFVLQGALWVSDSDINDQLQPVLNTGGQQTGWMYKVAADNSVESYDISGKLTSIQEKDGFTISLQYSDGTSGPGGDVYLNGRAANNAIAAGLLIDVRNSFGSSIRFRYGANDKVLQAIDPNNNIYQFSYDASQDLTGITYPDNKLRTFYYNEAAFTNGANLPGALTGITDENGVRFVNYTYDTDERAIDEVLPGAGTNTDHSHLTFDASTLSTSVTDSLGTVRVYAFQNVLGALKLISQSQPGGAGCGGASSNFTYDTNGNVASRTDFNGNKTTYTYDLSRNLETSRVEASGTLQVRTISTQWHPTYRLPVAIAEPLRLTTYSYDGSGNLLLKTIQATTDSNGSQSFNAQVTGTSRTWSYTYNQYGQVLTAKGPRTDINDTTTYSYDNSTGNLLTITNAAGQVTTLSNYDANGRVGMITDPNGIVTILAYYPRGWLQSKSARSADGSATQTTTYDYDGVGQLKNVTLPDNSTITYTYDDAHRLTDIADSLGNTIHYVLDPMGNRTDEQVKDMNGTLTRHISRLYDTLNRLQQVTGGVQ
jgi:YD repeat-containing protein